MSSSRGIESGHRVNSHRVNSHGVNSERTEYYNYFPFHRSHRWIELLICNECDRRNAALYVEHYLD
jgi:hypothetical protein